MASKQQLERILRRKEYRDLKPVEQGARLVVELKVGWSLAEEVTGASQRAIRRAIQAKEEGREVGQIGRPRSLTTEEEVELSKRVLQAIDKRDPLTYKEFQQQVSFV
jgi:hypothetical protein